MSVYKKEKKKTEKRKGQSLRNFHTNRQNKIHVTYAKRVINRARTKKEPTEKRKQKKRLISHQ